MDMELNLEHKEYQVVTKSPFNLCVFFSLGFVAKHHPRL